MYKFHFNSEIQRWSWLPTPTRTDYVTVSVTFPKDGLAQFKLDVPSGTTSITLDVRIYVKHNYIFTFIKYEYKKL